MCIYIYNGYNVYTGWWRNHPSEKYLYLYIYYPLVMTNMPWYRWPIEIDGLPFLKMVDLSMANC